MKISPPPRRPASLAPVSLAIVSLAVALAGASAARAEDKAAILLPGSANDQSWNALGYSILKSLEPHGFKTAYSENVADADEAEALRDYANQGYEIVMGHSGRFVSAMEQVAPDFPKTQFIAVSGNEGKPPNVMSIDWNNAQFGCQLGLLAAQDEQDRQGRRRLRPAGRSQHHRAGRRVPHLRRRRRARKVTILYIKDMEDAAEAKEAALSLIAGGRGRHHRQTERRRSGPCPGGEGKACLCDGARAGPDQDRARTRAHKHCRGLAGDVRLDRRSGEVGQAVRNLRSIRLRHRARHRRPRSNTNPGKPFNPIVPAAVVKELDDMAAAVQDAAR